MEYRRRIIEPLVKSRLESMGALLLQGPKWCGKTTTAESFAKSTIYLDNPAQQRQYRQIAEVDPSQFLVGATPRLLDEWQLFPQIWDSVRFEVDHRHAKGQFILTGSSVLPSTDLIRHSGTGRIARLTMRPMTLYESGDSSGQVSLKGLFEGIAPRGQSDKTLKDIAIFMCRGGWPESALEKSGLSPINIAANEYVENVVTSDISRVDGVMRQSEMVRRLLRSYSRCQGTQTPLSIIAADVNGEESMQLSEKTLATYINALREIFFIEDMPAWNPNIRSKTAIRTSDTRYFIDPSLACASLGIGPEDLLADLETMGLIFETLCVRDLRVYAQTLNGTVYHYRDKNGLECDAVVHLRNGQYGLVEIKLGGDTAIKKATDTLLSLEAKINTEKMGKPSFKMILTAVGDFAYEGKDGVSIVPIATLRE
ncbi:MAG: DUF4143 domain-containing protein [Bacteroidales bacterium]|nr:DUF4143 domain-containing protein [Bacteroidales bacterium]